jgi:hypothetical protein
MLAARGFGRAPLVGKLVGENQRGMRSKSGGLAANCKGSVRNGCGYPMVFIVSRVVWF